ncbi:MAG: polyprenyl synthetase family protein [bacterium]|nr:polyprenyl synthetase family protein [bacterium]
MKTIICSEITILDTYKEFEKKLFVVDEIIKNCLKTEDKYINNVIDYLKDHSGKKLRPLLVLISASINGKENSERDTCLAAAVELIHTATLIHDDVVDGAHMRRFKPTLNYELGNSISVISGDYLFSKAILLLTDNAEKRVLKIMAQAISKVCEGEMIQQQKQFNDKMSQEEYLEIIEKKTASLISACCKSGISLGSDNEIIIKALENYGLNIGMAFQIVDDCLDLVFSEEKLGKDVGNDLSKGSLTLPVIYLLNKNRKINDIFKYDRKKLIKLLQEDGCIEYALDVGKKYIGKAKENLNVIENVKAKNYLSAIADYVIERKK